jgi:hypothetical protein
MEKSAAWNANSTKFTYVLFFELWLYKGQTGSVAIELIKLVFVQRKPIMFKCMFKQLF